MEYAFGLHRFYLSYNTSTKEVYVMKEQVIEMIQEEIENLRNEGLKETSIAIQSLKELMTKIYKIYS